MKVKAITKYKDTQLDRLIEAGEEIEVTDARASILINARVAEAVATLTPEVATEGKPKKAPAKSKKKEA